MTGLEVSTFGYTADETKEDFVNEVIVTHPDTVDIGARVRLTDTGLIVEQWRTIDERLDILGDERLRD